MNTDAPKPGRPRKNKARNYYDGDLHALLAAALPPEYIRVGRVRVAVLAEKLDRSRFTVGSWLIEDRLPRKVARPLIALAPGKITEVDLLPFLLA